MNDPYHLQRFVEAQQSAIEDARTELQQGKKQGHWIWFMFPQIKGLGHSPTAQRFGISSREEAQAYLQHPMLGPRLRELTLLVTAIEGRTLEDILGYPDNLKFKSSMTLFSQSTSDNQIFLDALHKYCGGELDSLTLDRLR